MWIGDCEGIGGEEHGGCGVMQDGGEGISVRNGCYRGFDGGEGPTMEGEGADIRLPCQGEVSIKTE